MRDWHAIAQALQIELSGASLDRLRGLEKTMLGLRGLVDWKEEPASLFPGEIPAWPEPAGNPFRGDAE